MLLAFLSYYYAHYYYYYSVIWYDTAFDNGLAAIKKNTGFFCGMEVKKKKGKLLKNCLEKISHMSLTEQLGQSSLFFSSNYETYFQSRLCTLLLISLDKVIS